MRLKISKSKNTTLFYIIKDFTKNGKRSTKVVKRIGNLEEIKTMAGNIDYNIWLKNYIKDFNLENDNKETILIKKSNRKIVEKDSNNNFNVGYLFIKKL